MSNGATAAEGGAGLRRSTHPWLVTPTQGGVELALGGIFCFRARGGFAMLRASPVSREIRSAAPARAAFALRHGQVLGARTCGAPCVRWPRDRGRRCRTRRPPRASRTGSAAGAAQLVQGADADVQVRGGFTNPKPATAQRLPVDAAVRAQLRVFTRVHVTALRTAANSGPAKTKRLPEIGVTISPKSRRNSISRRIRFLVRFSSRPRPRDRVRFTRSGAPGPREARPLSPGPNFSRHRSFTAFLGSGSDPEDISSLR